jgi:hypothetical protein
MRSPAIVPSALAALALAACAAGSVGDTAGSEGSGTAPLRGDAIPAGAVSFFQTTVCPEGWAPHADAAGRVLLPGIGDVAPGTKYGEPLASGEDRLHSHEVSAELNLTPVSYAGIAGGGNAGVASAGKVAFSATTEPASTSLPYVQMLACKKAEEAVARARPLPSGMLMFFDANTCPEGWKQATATQGRLLVGLPAGAPADVSFGGDPLSIGEPRTHAHSSPITLKTSPHGIALASGCCGDGYAKDGAYTSLVDTSEGEAALPMLQLLQCQKE